MSAIDEDDELIVRYFGLRWWKSVQDLVHESEGKDHLAFDDLLLANDLQEVAQATGAPAIEAFAKRVLAPGAPRPDGDPLLALLDRPAPAARAFLALVAASIAFSLRTDALLDALAAFAAAGPAPRLSPEDLGRLLGRARSLRDARARLEAAPLAAGARAAALAALEALDRSVPPGAACAHIRAEEVPAHEAIGLALARQGLVEVPWISRVASDHGRRLIALRRRGGWVALLAPRGVERELALEIARGPGVACVAWVDLAAARLSVFEGSRVADDEARLAARAGAAPDAEDVQGALRARGVLFHDPASVAERPSLVWEDYSPLEGAPISPSVLRRLRATGLAYARKDAAREADQKRRAARASRKSK